MSQPLNHLFRFHAHLFPPLSLSFFVLSTAHADSIGGKAQFSYSAFQLIFSFFSPPYLTLLYYYYN